MELGIYSTVLGECYYSTNCVDVNLVLREHPFNLKGWWRWGAMVFWGKIISVQKSDRIFFVCLWHGQNKNIVFVEKNNVVTTCCENKFPLRLDPKKQIWLRKKYTHPPPRSTIKLNGWSLNTYLNPIVPDSLEHFSKFLQRLY